MKFSIRFRSVGKFDPVGEDYFCSIVLAYDATVCVSMTLDGEFFPRVGSVVMPSILDERLRQRIQPRMGSTPRSGAGRP